MQNDHEHEVKEPFNWWYFGGIVLALVGVALAHVLMAWTVFFH